METKFNSIYSNNVHENSTKNNNIKLESVTTKHQEA